MFDSMRGMMSGGFSSLGLLGLLTWLVWLGVGVLLFLWLWEQLHKK